MLKDNDDFDSDFCFTEEGKLRHENKYLKERIENLESFKSKFFKLTHELIEAKDKIGVLEQQVVFDEIKSRVFDELHEQTTLLKGGYGNDILQFFNEGFTASSYQDLIMSVFQSIEALVSDVTVLIKFSDSEVSYALNESSKEVNTQLINRYKNDGEAIEQDAYIIINCRHMSILAKYHSGQGAIEKQNINEYLRIVALGSNARIDVILNRCEIEDLRKKIYGVFKKVNNSFDEMQNSSDQQVIFISEMYSKYEKNLRQELHRMGLSDQYMELINIILRDAKSELNLLLTSVLSMDGSFLAAMKKLEKAYAKEYQGD